MNIYGQIAEWIKQYEPVGSWIYFNVTNYEAGFISLNSVTMSRYLYIDILGNKTVELVCAVDMIKPYDTGTSTNNLDAIQEVENFAEWIEQQPFPDFGEGKAIKKIEILENGFTPAVDSDLNLAKYQFQIKFTYLELGGIKNEA